MCYDSANRACIDWGVILYAMLITNICGVIFETAFAYSFEMTLRPTSYLDKQEDPDYQEDDIDGQLNPDVKKEPKCNVVMAKCWGEMIGIFMYCFFAFILLTGCLSTFEDGKPLTVLIELSIAIFIDQLKSIPIQFIIWIVVIRRCFKFEVQNFEEWDDDKILENGSEPSLLNYLRTTVQNFIKHPIIDTLILGMTLFLCVVIFSEMAMPTNFDTDEATGERNLVGDIYYIINYFLLSFFVVEIALKIFADGLPWLLVFINVFDSIVVLVSFVFQVINIKVSFVGLLRILRLIKVITEMKKTADKNRAKKEHIKK